MVERTARTLAVLSSVFLLLSFALFTYDQVYGASKRQVAMVNGVDLTLPQPSHRRQPRRFIDGVARTLLQPFAGTATSRTPWGERGVPTLVALLVYGVGLAFFARWAGTLERRPARPAAAPVPYELAAARPVPPLPAAPRRTLGRASVPPPGGVRRAPAAPRALR